MDGRSNVYEENKTSKLSKIRPENLTDRDWWEDLSLDR